MLPRPRHSGCCGLLIWVISMCQCTVFWGCHQFCAGSDDPRPVLRAPRAAGGWRLQPSPSNTTWTAVNRAGPHVHASAAVAISALCRDSELRSRIMLPFNKSVPLTGMCSCERPALRSQEGQQQCAARAVASRQSMQRVRPASCAAIVVFEQPVAAPACVARWPLGGHAGHPD